MGDHTTRNRWPRAGDTLPAGWPVSASIMFFQTLVHAAARKLGVSINLSSPQKINAALAEFHRSSKCDNTHGTKNTQHQGGLTRGASTRSLRSAASALGESDNEQAGNASGGQNGHNQHNDNDKNNATQSSSTVSKLSLDQLASATLAINQKDYTQTLDKSSLMDLWDSISESFRTNLIENNNRESKTIQTVVLELCEYLGLVQSQSEASTSATTVTKLASDINKETLDQLSKLITPESMKELYSSILYTHRKKEKDDSGENDLSLALAFKVLIYLNNERIKEINRIIQLLSRDRFMLDQQIIVATGGRSTFSSIRYSRNRNKHGLPSIKTSPPRGGSAGSRHHRNTSYGGSRSGSESPAPSGSASGSKRLRNWTRSRTRTPSPWSACRSPANSLPITDPIKLTKWRKSALFIVERICEHKNALTFMSPVKEDRYTDLIRKPMCLELVKTRVRKGAIKSTSELHRDLMLVMANAVVFNGSQADVSLRACELRDFIQSQISTLQETP